MLSVERKKQMVANSEFNEFIDIIGIAIKILLEEQENGGKVSILLDKEEIPSIAVTER
jgi:hypothetical protein